LQQKRKSKAIAAGLGIGRPAFRRATIRRSCNNVNVSVIVCFILFTSSSSCLAHSSGSLQGNASPLAAVLASLFGEEIV
jgi:hypothetical protein